MLKLPIDSGIVHKLP